jgi:pimeloyl-ACP methyl ester carboxylesterase
VRRPLRVLLVIPGLLVIASGAFVVWGETPARPMPEALAALQSDTQVTVNTGKWLVFTPAASQPTTGFIIYPGGRVDYRAYAPQAHAIAAQGYLVVIVRMPLNLAVLDPAAAAEVIAAHPEIKTWAVGGHSLGGSMAAHFAHSHPEAVQGLVLWASYPAGSDDLSESNLKVGSISGTLDGLSTPDKIAASHALLPTDTVWIPISGGDHAQFGWYGPQAGDNPASISRAEQQAQLVQATVDFLSALR